MSWRVDWSYLGHEAVVETRPARNLSMYFAISLTVDGREAEPVPGSSGWEWSDK
jgi:hypothetical protein